MIDSNADEPQSVHLNFEGFKITLHAASDELRNRVEADFSFFSVRHESPPDLEITAKLSPPPDDLNPRMSTFGSKGRKSRNCTMYDLGRRRINDYDGEALVDFDFANSKARAYSTSLHRLHEVTYLLILSRAGKALDLRGRHRLHAMAARIGDLAVVCAMPMGGGTSTLLLELLRDSTVELISDDSPIVTSSGEVRRFPIRLGFKPDGVARWTTHPNLRFEQAYELERMHYGKKHLLPVSAIRNKVCAPDSSRVCLVTGSRSESSGCEISEASCFKSAPVLFMNLVIGVGLPMMREYFIEPGWRGHATLLRIFLLRLRAALNLALRAKHLTIRLGPDPELNVATLRAFLDGPALASTRKAAYSQSRK